MKKKNIRLAVVGYGTPAGGDTCGRGGSLFKLAVKCFDGVAPAAVCDTNAGCLKNAKHDFPDIKVCNDYDEMIADGSIDAVIIGTPATYHAELAVKALNHNIHVLSEIPSIYTIQEAQLLWKTHLKSKAIYMTGANMNFAGFIDTAVDLKQRGLFGNPIYIEAAYIHDVQCYFDQTPWRAQYESIRYCTHSLGPVLRLIDEDLLWVSCFDTGSHINQVKGQHDAMAALFRTKSNVVVRLLVSFINHYLSEGHSYRFFTTKGCFERTPPYRTFRNEACENERTLFYSKELKTLKNWIELPIAVMPAEVALDPKASQSGHGGVDYAMLKAFFAAIREQRPSPLGLREGLRMSLPGIYAAESARKGGELIRIQYPWSNK